MTHPTVGFLGLGNMGLPMATHLLAAGYPVLGYDLRDDANAALRAKGGSIADDAPALVQQATIICTSLVSPAYLKVADTALLPHARPDHTFIDFSTVPAPQTRRIAAALQARGSATLDAPVSGGDGGARAATLFIFVGGKPETFDRCLPLLQCLGRTDRIIHGGPDGSGQVLKVMQQLKHRLLDAARLEVLAFGFRHELPMDMILRTLDVDPDSNDGYAQLAHTITADRGHELGCLITEWPYYLDEAREADIPMPMLDALHRFCQGGPSVYQDTQSRHGPSVWNELLHRTFAGKRFDTT